MTTQRDLDRDLGADFDARSISRAPDGLLDAALGWRSSRHGSGRACSSPTGGGRGGW